MFDLPTNDTRASWAEMAIQAFEEATNVDREDAIGDLLCGLMHHCNLNGGDFLAELNRGAGHFQAEIEIEAAEDEGKDVDPSQSAENPHHYVKCDGFAARDNPEHLRQMAVFSDAPDVLAALKAMWAFASTMIERHGMNGDDTMTEADHLAWQDAAYQTSAAIAKAEGRADG